MISPQRRLLANHIKQTHKAEQYHQIQQLVNKPIEWLDLTKQQIKDIVKKLE